MLYVTHDQDEALNLGDSVAVLDRGVLQQVDRPSTLLQSPANRFVAGFLGSPPWSLLDGQLRTSDGRLEFVGVRGCRWSIPATRQEWANWAGREVTLGARPEETCLRSDLSFRETQAPIFEVRLVERHGSGCLVTLERDNWRLAALVPPNEAPMAGQCLTALPNWDSACLFDFATGRALSHGESAR
jgi:multiple sugar transport system ATP-binding protein